MPETGTEIIGRSGSSQEIWIDLIKVPASCGVNDTKRMAEPLGGIFIAESSALAPQHALIRDTDIVEFPVLRSSVRPTTFEPTDTSPKTIPSALTASLGAANEEHVRHRLKITQSNFTSVPTFL
jgi:hypothetical protein